MPRWDITLTELKLQMKAQGVKVAPSYCHEDYRTATLSMPYPLFNKLDRLARRYDISRSMVFRLLLDSVDEEEFLSQVGFGE